MVTGWCFGTMEFYDFPFSWNMCYPLVNSPKKLWVKHNQMVTMKFSNENLSIHGEVFLHEIRPIPWIPTRQVAGANQIMRSIEKNEFHILENLHKQVKTWFKIHKLTHRSITLSH